MEKRFKILCLASIGGIVEYYDFYIYIFLATFIADKFFPGPLFTRLFLTYSIFAVGYLLRPVSSIFLGYLRSKYGEKKISLFSIFIMTWATFFMGCIPDYHAIGIAAPLLLLLFKAIQGLVLGGEIPSSITYVQKNIKEKKRVFAGTIVLINILLGVLTASFVAAVIMLLFTTFEIKHYAWRIPFLLGGILGGIGWYIRCNIITANTAKAKKNYKEEKLRIPIFDIIEKYALSFFIGMSLALSMATMIIFFFLMLPSYLIFFYNYDYSTSFQINILSSFILVISTILISIIISKTSIKTWVVLLIGNLLTIPASIFVFNSFINFNITNLTFSLILMAIIVGFSNSTLMVVLAKLFTDRARYSGLSSAYNIAMALAGCLVPATIVFGSRYYYNIYLIPLYFILFVCVLGTVSAALVPVAINKIKKRPKITNKFHPEYYKS
ncbi:MAG: MFS transporter [bacterium]|nr:MFS transporter [bacterium]